MQSPHGLKVNLPKSVAGRGYEVEAGVDEGFGVDTDAATTPPATA